MDRTMIEDAVFPGCPIRNILSKLCDKWSLLVIYTLDKSDKRTIRFKELQREIPDISQKMLTVTLRTLESDGYVTRGVSGSSSQGRVRADGSDALLASAYKRLDRMGTGEYGRYHEGQEEGPRALAYDDGHCQPFRMPILRNERCPSLAPKDAHRRKR